PMDLKGDAVWKFFDVEPDESGKKTGRSTSWTGVTYFYDYAKANTGFGLCAKVDANVFSAEAGDIMQVGDGTGDFVHTIVSLGAITDKEGNIIDINTVSNTTDRKNYPMSAYNCPYIRLIKIYGYNN
ncbi:MAG: amidase domain-containing protein, partial [Firmicutes bacterium]|nr:amidase domain-containing protein [Bacillota bacterium]